MSQSYDHNLLVALVSIGVGILLINTILLISHMKDRRNMRRDDDRENYSQDPRYDTKMWDNGGVYNGIGVDFNPFQTKQACSCSGYGVKRNLNQDMPFDDDSNLYNSPLLKPQNLMNK